MSTLSNLNSRLTNLNDQKNSLKSSLNIYNQRKKDIEGLIRTLTNVVDNNYGIVNRYASSIANNISGAIKGSGCVVSIETSVSDGKEKESSSDGNIVSALNGLRSELNQVNTKINNLNADLTSVNNQISNTRTDITNEKIRLAREAARKAEEEARKKAEELKKLAEQLAKNA
ncbi:hypothetical protein ACTNA4_05845 [Bariatricus sp. HCP28S3_A7]|uniref:hypothetical protein n=1 Tax=Bariatricus sp. HCP28S3_A7 TaxID=3438894 RepID=UPI003F8CD626